MHKAKQLEVSESNRQDVTR